MYDPGSGRLPVEFVLQVVDGLFEGGFAAEGVDQFDQGAELVQRRDLEYVGVVEVEHAFVGVFGQQGVEDGAGLVAVLGEYVAFEVSSFQSILPEF